MFMDIALSLGKEKLYSGLKSMGISEKTGIDMSGEGKGLLIDYDLVKNVDTARIGFGQAVAVTAIELITACAAVINGGELLKPYIVAKAVTDNGIVLYNGKKEIKRKIVSVETSKIMREVLESVVSEGGGKNAQVNGYRIGGKTGTAEVAGKRDYAIFCGFAPIEEPKIVVSCILEEGVYGNRAAYTVARVMEKYFENTGE